MAMACGSFARGNCVGPGIPLVPSLLKFFKPAAEDCPAKTIFRNFVKLLESDAADLGLVDDHRAQGQKESLRGTDDPPALAFDLKGQGLVDRDERLPEQARERGADQSACRLQTHKNDDIGLERAAHGRAQIPVAHRAFGHSVLTGEREVSATNLRREVGHSAAVLVTVIEDRKALERVRARAATLSRKSAVTSDKS